MYESACKYCTRPIESDCGGPGALWFGIGFLNDDEVRDWCCDKNLSKNIGGYEQHRPEVWPEDVEAAIESIRKDA